MCFGIFQLISDMNRPRVSQKWLIGYWMSLKRYLAVGLLWERPSLIWRNSGYWLQWWSIREILSVKNTDYYFKSSLLPRYIPGKNNDGCHIHGNWVESAPISVPWELDYSKVNFWILGRYKLIRWKVKPKFVLLSYWFLRSSWNSCVKLSKNNWNFFFWTKISVQTLTICTCLSLKKCC